MNATDSLRSLLKESGVALESESARRLTVFLALLVKWNARMNLTSSTEWDAIGPMFREGIWAAARYPDAAAEHLDIGSGAGFPALLLGIFHPRLRLELVESREKKSRFLETAAYSLGLRQVRVHNGRLSDFLRKCPKDKSWDCVSWKALKLDAGDLLLLHRHAREGTQFWMFHGLEPSWEETEEVRQRFALLRKEKVPGRKESYLSIYAAK